MEQETIIWLSVGVLVILMVSWTIYLNKDTWFRNRVGATGGSYTPPQQSVTQTMTKTEGDSKSPAEKKVTGVKTETKRTSGLLSFLKFAVGVALLALLVIGAFVAYKHFSVNTLNVLGKTATVITLKVPPGGLQEGEKMVYGPFPIPAEGWGQEIENPQMEDTRHQLKWSPIGATGDSCEFAINGNREKTYPCGTFIEEGVRTFQFRSKNGKPFGIEIELKRKNN